MNLLSKKLVFTYILLSLLISSCGAGGTQKPDLTAGAVYPELESLGYCYMFAPGTFAVNVKNQGNADAPISTVKVEFFPGGTFTEEVRGPGTDYALPAGISWDILFYNSPPSSCFNPDCEFRITIDSENQVDELDEGNNVIEGHCLG